MAVGLVALALGGQVPVVSAVERFRIDSEPAGARVFTIGGRVGTTPLTLSERDIYPNSYPPEDVDLYGVIILRRDGCTDYRRRVTRSDIEQGILARLDCGASAAAVAPAVPAPEPPATRPAPARPSAAPPPEAAAESPAQRRLRQLRVIQELHDEGLLSDAEEQSIRRRILEAD
ncbi:peptidase associated/transthyretin-like domain-containing protein [Thiohalobacter thiocyanaticus]|uniref:hypothetical protein n=1 Tax=Thiohalobacter thiocyanaticus TaxID=585455 RepID=UPI0019D4123D|nr:hypothetical protein [Thiohalobacter thiocyanaticus]